MHEHLCLRLKRMHWSQTETWEQQVVLRMPIEQSAPPPFKVRLYDGVIRTSHRMVLKLSKDWYWVLAQIPLSIANILEYWQQNGLKKRQYHTVFLRKCFFWEIISDFEELLSDFRRFWAILSDFKALLDVSSFSGCPEHRTISRIGWR